MSLHYGKTFRNYSKKMKISVRYLSHSAVLSASWQWCCNNTINLASILWAPTLQPHWDEECWSTTFSVMQWTTWSVSVWTMRCWDCSRTRTRKRCIHSTHPHSQTWQNTISWTSESTSVNFLRKKLLQRQVHHCASKYCICLWSCRIMKIVQFCQLPSKWFSLKSKRNFPFSLWYSPSV